MHKRHKPRARDFFSNLDARMPFSKKLSLLIRNNATKILKGQSCCGHPGEPGC